MAVEKQNKNGRLKLKQDLAKGSFETLYILYGEEAYLREYYLRQLRKKVVDETFADFNLIELDGKTLTLRVADRGSRQLSGDERTKAGHRD